MGDAVHGEMYWIQPYPEPFQIINMTSEFQLLRCPFQIAAADCKKHFTA
jgi:hypothetical protein